MTTLRDPVKLPRLAPMMAEMQIRCAGKRKDGTLCDWLIFRGTIEHFEGKLEFACPKCHKRTVFT